MSQVTISRDDAVAICIGLGFKTAQSWDKKRMLRKLGDIAEMVNDSGLKIEDDIEDAARLNKLLKAIGKAQGDVSVVKDVRDEEPAAEEEPVAAEQEEVSDDSGDEESTEDEPEATEDTEPVKPVKGEKKTKPVKEKKTKAGKKTGKSSAVDGPSNKEQAWNLYQQAGKDEREEPKKLAKVIHPKVPAVKESTVSGWISMWNHGKGLPACAKRSS